MKRSPHRVSFGSSVAAASPPASPAASEAQTISLTISSHFPSSSTGLGRCISVTKFNPRQVSGTLSSSKREKSHVSIKMNPGTTQQAKRWPDKPMMKKDIEAKPWYMRSFDEVVELHCGDAIRAEKFPQYNKSFVTKMRSPTRPEETAKDERSLQVATPPSSSKAKRASAPLQRSLSSDNATPGSTPSRPRGSVGQQSTRNEKEIVREVKMQHLRLQDMAKLIEKADREIATLETNAKHDYRVIQDLIVSTKQSDEDLQKLRHYAGTVLTNARSVVKKLISCRKIQQTNYDKYESAIKEFQDAHMQELRWQPIDKLTNLIAEEERRNRVKQKVQRILLLFAATIKAKGYTANRPLTGSAATRTAANLSTAGGLKATNAQHSMKNANRFKAALRRRVSADSTRKSIYDLPPPAF
eukprot:gene7756-8567_t